MSYYQLTFETAVRRQPKPVTIIRVSPDEPQPPRKAVEALRSGGVIAFPTEEGYVVGCDALDSTAVQHLCEVTGAASEHLVRFAASREQAGRLTGLARPLSHPVPLALMRAADLLLVTSGTATLEAALLGTPMVVCYRLSRVTEFFCRLLVRVPWISLVNIALGRSVVPELFFERATADRLAGEVLHLLEDPDACAAQRRAFAELRGQLGEPGVGTRAARLVLATAGVIP